MNILLTGGTGYIGSHTALALLSEGHQVFLYDNLVNSKREVVSKIEAISGMKAPFIEGDVRDTQQLTEVLRSNKVDRVIHFAGLKAVGESSTNPLLYFSNNVSGIISLLNAMNSSNIHQLVFSSSCTVYGNAQSCPISEDHALNASSPYGQSKLISELMLKDLCNSNPLWRVACLRYFNPVGAHQSGLIGEDPNGIPNNLMPYITRVAAGRSSRLNIFGNDYPTDDGTGVRDYIHVMDLAEGHLAALSYLDHTAGFEAFNLGTGKGVSVLDVVSCFEESTLQKVPYQVVARRSGDVAKAFAKVDKAKKLLGWGAKLGLREMCISSWEWQKNSMR